MSLFSGLKRIKIREAMAEMPPERPQKVKTNGQSWSDDLFANLSLRVAQYRLAAGLLLGLSAVLGIAIIVMLPLHQTELIVVHQAQNGLTWVDVPTSQQSLPTEAQTQSEIVSYLTNRESYSAFSYDYQFKLVNVMSDESVAKMYREEESATNPASTIARLGKEGIKKVHIESVMFLDNENQNNPSQGITRHANLAQINFTVTTQSTGESQIQPYTAMVSWTYRGTPDEPDVKWLNWDGFTVTHFTKAPRNLASTGEDE